MTPTATSNRDRNGIGALPFCVARIAAGVFGNPMAVGHGTGFFYNFKLPGGIVPCLVSNKHVLLHRPWIEVGFGAADASGGRALKPALNVRVEEGQLPIIGHPDPNVDLAVMPINPLSAALQQAGNQPFVLTLDDSVRISGEKATLLAAATDVLMVGFPNGLMDTANNLPVVRRGSLATPYRADYEGRKDFVVDIAAFGGSSGSPVFAFYNGLEPTQTGFQLGGQSSYLIGVLHSGPFLNAEGKIEKKPVPTESVAITRQMIHLGYCAKISLLDDFIGPLSLIAGLPSTN